MNEPWRLTFLPFFFFVAQMGEVGRHLVLGLYSRLSRIGVSLWMGTGVKSAQSVSCAERRLRRFNRRVISTYLPSQVGA